MLRGPVAFAGPALVAKSAVFEEAHLPGAEFWYEFASTYSYPAALRVAALADDRGVGLVWRPFLLGPIFMA